MNQHIICLRRPYVFSQKMPPPLQVEIAASQNLSLELNAAELLAESCGNDIRQVLNCLQMWQRTSTSCKYMDVKDRLK